MDTTGITKRTGLSRLVHRREKGKIPPAGESSQPSPEQTETFFRRRGSTLHPAFGVESRWDDNEKKFKAEERLAIEHLERVLYTHDADVKHGGAKLYNCSWATVFEQLAQARQEHGRQRDWTDATKLGIEITTQYVDLVPEEYGLGVIKGTLGLIFESVQKHMENKAKILQAFEEMPETILTINVACAYLDATEIDLAIQRAFYNRIVRELPKLVELLLGKEKWYKKVASFFELRIRETMFIDDVLSRWNAYIRTLHEHVERMKTKVMAEGLHHSSEAHRHAEEANGKLDIMNKKMDGHFNTLEDAILQIVKAQVRGLWDKIEAQWLRANDTGAEAQTGLYGDIQLLMKQQARDIEYFRQLAEAQQMDNNWLQLGEPLPHVFRRLALLIVSLENSNLSHDNEVLRSTTPEPESESDFEPHPIVSVLGLLGVLNIAPQATWDDLDLVLQDEGRHNDKQLGRARWLLRTDEFQSWFQGLQSSILLLEGELSQSTDKVTPLSIFGARFVTSLVNSPPTVVLSFFCGLHCGDEEEEPEAHGPNAMLRSLITQLLLSDRIPKLSLECITVDFLEACDAWDTRALSELFEQLVFQVPPYIQVFCILDGVGWYEADEAWTDDLAYVAAMFEHLVGQMDEDRFCSLKVLMTFSTRSLEVSDRAERRSDIWKIASLAAGHTDPTHISAFAEVTELIDGVD